MATPESKVKAGVKKWLDARGIWHTSPIGTVFGKAGVPDILACWNGRFLAIECKAPGKRNNTTALQKHQLASIMAAGGMAIVVDNPSDMDSLT